MMRHRTTLVILIFLSPVVASVAIWVSIAAPAPINKPVNGQSDRDGIDAAAIDQYITARMLSDRIPGFALAIVKGGRIVYLKGYGKADESGRLVTPQTSFIIGSVTKAFTAVAVMQLADAGEVELDAPVQRYIRWFRVADPQASAQITVRQLLNQTSGLPMIREAQGWTDQDPGVLERAVRLLEREELVFPSGQSYGYSNANYETLGVIVQQATGESYEEYVKRHIFAPLDMQNSFVSQDEAQQHGMASGYRWWFGFPFAFNPPYNRAEAPAGYIISSAEDMSHFLIAEMNQGQYRDRAIITPNAIALTQTEPVPNTYAMGWVTGTRDGHTLINHEGGTANFQCSVFFEPEAQVGVFVAANVMVALDAVSSPHGSDPLDGTTTRAMAQSILSMATGRPLPDKGRGIRLSYAIFDLALLLLSTLFVASIVRIPAQWRRLSQKGISHRSTLARHIGVYAGLHFVWPLFLLFLVVWFPTTSVLALYQPDLTYWLSIVAVLVFVRGVVKIALTWQVFRQTARA